MQRLTLFAGLLATLAALAPPAAAAPPAGWTEGGGVSGSLTVLRAVSPAVALAGGLSGQLERTEDGGATWTSTTPPSDADLRDLASTDGTTIFALDARGAVQRSRDGGSTWNTLAVPPEAHPLALVAWGGGHLLIVAPRELLLSSDDGDSFEPVTPKPANAGDFAAAGTAGAGVLVYGSRSLMVADAGARTWRRLALPAFARGDSVLRASFVAPGVGYVLSSFRNLYRTTDGGRSWAYLVGTGGAGEDLSFSDARHGWLAAPGFANRFDGYVLHTTDGGLTWRPQAVAPRFVSTVAAAGAGAFAIGNEGGSLFVNHDGGETGRTITLGFRPQPRRAVRGGRVTIRGRVAPARRGVGVAVSMRSAGRWIVRYAVTNAAGAFTASFVVQQRAGFIAQVATGPGHSSAATRPLYLPVGR